MILCVGEILVDLIGSTKNKETTFQTFAGGAPFNVACGIAKWGGKVEFIGNVGTDLMGKFLVDFAATIPFFKTTITQDEKHNTTLAFVSNDEDGERHFSFYRNQTADYHISKNFLKHISDTSIIHLGSLLLSEPKGRMLAKKVVSFAKKHHLILSFDVNYRSDLFKDEHEALKIYQAFSSKADYLKLSLDELTLFTGEADFEKGLKKMAQPNQTIFLTLGKEGSLFYQNDRLVKVPSINVKPIDTTGAGDAFYAGILFNLDDKKIANLNDEEIYRIMRFSNVAGALSTTQKGAIDSLPTLAQIRELM